MSIPTPDDFMTLARRVLLWFTSFHGQVSQAAAIAPRVSICSACIARSYRCDPLQDGSPSEVCTAECGTSCTLCQMPPSFTCLCPARTRRGIRLCESAGYAGADGQHGLHDWAIDLVADLPQNVNLVRLTPESTTAAVLKRQVRKGSISSSFF